ncbi:MAG: penicillin acylase family protein [Holophagales bacterium]|nr:penicillin acylase family protein [Holophagales bacterium]MYG29520.1 penicillin acylase family protein [Holophagales bacterium]MYI79962.1 penicillin acylase family protein [Holophagales bacterium]
MRKLRQTAPAIALFLASTTAAQEIETTRFAVPGLAAAVEILVDRWGVAHVFAGGQDDLFFAQGWNAARDRLWQIDLWRRRGEGTLSEVFGPRFVEQDKAARLLLYRGDMHAEWLAYASDTKRIVTAWTRGVNAYVDLVLERPELMPPEFEALGYEPSHWTPEAVTRIRSHGLLRNATSEFSRAAFLNEHGPEALALRDRYQPDHRLSVQEGLDRSSLAAISRAIAVYRQGTRGVSFNNLEPGFQDAADAASQGSNNWAISPRRTATGRPLLANDPHRTQAVPSLRYIVHLSSPGLDLIGAGEPALPGISIGHNGTIAFGLTIFSIDQEDLYVYKTKPGEPDFYEHRGNWLPMETIEETIPVRGGDARTVELRFTRHGPVLYQDLDRDLAIGLRAAWLEPGMAPYLGSIEYIRARNWDQFLAAMNRWGTPSENQIYADTNGNIGWKPGGLAPVRPNWDGLLPVPGDGRYEWRGYRDMDELPVEFNPERGWVATANEMNLPDGYDVPLGWEWAGPYRRQRIGEVLDAEDAMTVEGAVQLQTDYVSIPARRLHALLGRASPTPEAGPALELLGGWNAELAADSAAAALFEVWWQRHLDDEVGRRMAAALGAGEDPLPVHDEHLLRMLEEMDPRLGDRPRRARDEALLDSLRAAYDDVSERLGTDPAGWRWGDLHQIELRHPLSAHLPDDLRRLADVGPAERGGSGDTVGNTSYGDDFRQRSGASFRMVIDVGNWDASVAMNNPGQSGDPRSPHYRDLFEPWANDQAFPLLYTRPAILEAAETRIELLPAPAE